MLKSRKVTAENEAETLKYGAAIYLRLSLENNGNEDDSSIENQLSYIQENFVKYDDVTVVNVFRDNGFTGTNFDRGGWCELFKQLQNGSVNCVVVKDFSRLGRNVYECGNLLETVFPFLGVRFISINDNFNSKSKQFVCSFQKYF